MKTKLLYTNVGEYDVTSNFSLSYLYSKETRKESVYIKKSHVSAIIVCRVHFFRLTNT